MYANNSLCKYSLVQLMLFTKLSHICCSPIALAHDKAIWDTRPTQRLTEFSNRRYSHPQPTRPVSLLLADLGICQHGLEASKQAICWHTPWEKINSFCEG